LFTAESLKTAGKVVAGALGAAIGGFVTVKLQEKRKSASIIELSNLLVQMGDPTQLTREQVAEVEAKYGATLTSSCLEDVKSLYGTFVEAVVPVGNTDLRGGEALLIRNFKNALGLDDIDAAPVHIDVGRRILRGRMEAGSRGEDFEARKTFQRLMYISGLVFGERQAAFLLPWGRVFGINDAQVQVARRDNARVLFSQYMAATGLAADRASLVALKNYQTEVRLADDEASPVVVEAEQAVLKAAMDRAIECIKRRTRQRDFTDAVTAVREAVDFNRAMDAFKGDAEVPRGVGAVSLAGTEWESAEGRTRDLRDLFR